MKLKQKKKSFAPSQILLALVVQQVVPKQTKPVRLPGKGQFTVTKSVTPIWTDDMLRTSIKIGLDQGEDQDISFLSFFLSHLNTMC